MNVLLTPELERFVAEKIKTGQYPDPSALVNQALEVLQEQETFDPEHEAYLRREINRGLDQLNRGERSPFNAETIIAEERSKISRGKGC